MTLFQLRDLVLHSGQGSQFKIECDALTDDDLKCLAWMGSQMLPNRFREVLGVPTGAERFARALDQYTDPESEYTLIVDDVWTTGKSWNDFQVDFARRTSYAVPTMGLVIFSRSSVPVWNNVYTIFQLNGMIR